MNFLKLPLLAVGSLLFATHAHSQVNHFCGQQEYQAQLYKTHPHLHPAVNPSFKKLEEFTKQYQQESKTKTQRNTNAVGYTVGYDYIIPVVVHVIHNNGLENISDATVERAIEMLNSFYAGTSAWDKFETQQYLNIRGGFNGNGKKIKFVLAKFDPNGNPTNGIDRKVDSYFTERGDDPAMRFKYNWPRNNYFNIYVVSQAIYNEGISGFATFPSEVDGANNAYLDGHIMSAWAFGEHKEMWQTWYHNLAHEVGHWLNLSHIWDDYNQNGANQNCNNGNDFVNDTPVTIGNSLADIDDFPGVGTVDTCTNKPGIDNYTNMMDYTAAVYAMFTQGQKDRMAAALESPVSERNKLWSKANVLAKIFGCTTGQDSDNDGIPDACDPCPTSATNDLDDDGVCDNVDSCNGFPDVNLDANTNAPDACDPLLPIINFKTTPFVAYDATEDNGVGFTYDNGATLYTSINAWKAVPKNYTITPNTVLEFDFKSSIQGQAHYIGVDNDLINTPQFRYKLFGTNRDTNSASLNTNYNTYTTTDLYTYKHYQIPIGQHFTGTTNYLIFAASNDLTNETWTSGTQFPGGGSYNEATSFFRNVKIYESTILSNENFNNDLNVVSAYSKDKNLIIESNTEIIQIEVFNLLGQLLLTDRNISSKTYTSKSINEMMVIVKIKLSDGNSITKKILIY